jgi:hypothetical protein
MSPEDYRGDEVDKLSDLAVIQIQDDNDPERHNRVASSIKKQLNASAKSVILDFSGVTTGKLDNVLKSWLKKQVSYA